MNILTIIGGWGSFCDLSAHNDSFGVFFYKFLLNSYMYEYIHVYEYISNNAGRMVLMFYR